MRGVVGEGATRPGRGPDDVAFGLPSRHSRLGIAARLTPLALVVPPLLAFILANPPAELMASLVPALALFGAIAVWTVVAPAGALSRRALVATILLTLLAVVVIVLDPTSHWLILFAYPASLRGSLDPSAAHRSRSSPWRSSPESSAGRSWPTRRTGSSARSSGRSSGSPS
jgi:hypothetical protein